MALEHVARFESVTLAAERLRTSQSAVSRHIRQMESTLGVALVVKNGRGISLTAEGRRYAQDVSEALSLLHASAERLQVKKGQLTIACTHEVSHLLLMPQFSLIREAVGKDAHIRILTCEYSALPAILDEGADIIFEYSRLMPKQTCAPLLEEQVTPVASLSFIAQNRAVLDLPPAAWTGLPRLELSKENSGGWATWADWFQAVDVSPPVAQVQMFDNYVYALDAATRGEGMVLAWRGFADRFISTGQLCPVSDVWHASGKTLFAVLTPNGALSAAARALIRFFSSNPMV